MSRTIKQFCIATLVNDPSAFENLAQSFRSAGFTDEHCNYIVLDNSDGNRYEPYSSLTRIASESNEKYVIFCHQDVIADRGDGREQLEKALSHLSTIDSNWAVAGNAGGTETLRLAMRVTDPSGVWQVGRLPREVQSLDENFLIIKPKANVGCSPELTGFHFYGTDLCLNAMKVGCTCYVVDFHITHLSAGNRDPTFNVCQQNMCRLWNKRFAARYVKTSCTMLFLSRYAWVRKWLGSQEMLDKMESAPLWHSLWTYVRRMASGKSPK